MRFGSGKWRSITAFIEGGMRSQYPATFAEYGFAPWEPEYTEAAKFLYK